MYRFASQRGALVAEGKSLVFHFLTFAAFISSRMTPETSVGRPINKRRHVGQAQPQAE